MSSAPASLRLPLPGLLGRSLAGGRGGLPLVERNARAYRHLWILLITGVLEPLFYLLSVKVGLGALVGPVTGPGGRPVGYTEFVAPALLATSSMNGAVYDSTFNVFHKLKYAKVYEAALATPLGPGDIALGEITWALSRGLLYAIMFLAVMAALGLVHSAWLLLAIPASVLIGFAFAGLGMAATTYMRSWKDFDFVILATLPMFLFSSHLLPAERLPPRPADRGGVHAAVPGGRAAARFRPRRRAARPCWATPPTWPSSAWPGSTWPAAGSAACY